MNFKCYVMSNICIIRQGHPLFLYIFTWYVEVLSYSLTNDRHNGSIHGAPISIGGFRINHLFFVYDSIIFWKAYIEEWGDLQSILHKYEVSSRQRLDRDMITLFFSKNIKVETQHYLCSVIGITAMRYFEKYLGPPIMIEKRNILASGHSGGAQKFWKPWW